MCDRGFVKANTNNLPVVDIFMVTEFFSIDSRFNAAKVRGAKASLACRESYGDEAIGYVQLKRDQKTCIVKCRICPEYKVRSKAYTVTLIVDEEEEKIHDIQCHDCAAATGGCQHAVALFMWLHRRSEDPAPTQITCYWRKSRLSSVGTALKYVEAKDLKAQNKPCVQPSSLPDNSTFLHEVLQVALSKQIDSQISRQTVDLVALRTYSLSLNRLALKFNLNGGLSRQDVCTFAGYTMTQDLCDEAERLTGQQAECPLWYELRYGRITSSKLYEAAHCKTDGGSLVNQIIGATKVHATSTMLRGKELEKLVLIEIEKNRGTRIKDTGLHLLSDYPALGASPDGITDEYIIETKCPSNEKSLQRFLKNSTVINPQCCAQMQLQMLANEKKVALFCVADPSFETTKKNTYSEAWVR